MSLCSLKPNYGSQCQMLDKSHSCSRFLGSKKVYISRSNAFNEDLNIQMSYFAEHIQLISPSSRCQSYLSLLLCHYLYPYCVPGKNQHLWDKKQHLCVETCHFLQEEVCRVKTGSISSLMKDFLDLRFENPFRDEVNKLFQARCQSKEFYQESKSDQTYCLFLSAYNDFSSSTSCYGNGHIYHGNISTTVANQTCQPWSKACLKSPVIDFSNISSADQNFCRNPGGYRKQPWCYVSEEKWEYCNIRQCPGIDGNYTTWSNWIFFDKQCIRKRSRDCANPSPKYGGKNCSTYGPPEEFQEYLDCVKDGETRKKLLLVILLLVPCLITIIGLYIRYKRISKDREKIYECIDDLRSSNDIYHYIVLQENTNENDDLDLEHSYVNKIYQHLKLFKSGCLCLNCVKEWLIYLINDEENGDEKQENVQEKIKGMLEGLGRYKSLKQNYDNDLTPISHSNKCFCEFQIKDWLQDHLSVNLSQYDKLVKDNDQNEIFLDTIEHSNGLYLLNGMKIYHRFKRNTDAEIT